MLTNEQIAEIIGEWPTLLSIHGQVHAPIYPDYAHNTDAALRVLVWLQAQALENDEYFFLAFSLLLLQEHSAKIIEETTLRMAILTAFEWFCKERES